MSAFSERTRKQDKEFQKWMRNGTVPFTYADPNFATNWPKYDVEKLFDLFLLEKERKKEGWYASFNDVFDDIMLAFAGMPPKVRDFAAEFDKAQKLLFTDCRMGVSKVLILARKGFFHAQLYAAELFYEGGYIGQNYHTAWKYLEQSMANGSEESFALAALMHARGCGRKKNRDVAREMLAAALKSKKAGNLQYMGLIFALGDIVPQDKETAETFLLSAVEKGFLQAGVIFFLLCDQGILDQPKNDPFDLLHSMVEYGYPPAEYMMSRYLLRLVLNDTSLNDELYKTALERASVCLGRCLQKSYYGARELCAIREPLTRADGVQFTIQECLERYYGQKVGITLEELTHSHENCSIELHDNP